MKKIKAFIFRDKEDSEGTINVIMEDGGVASAYNPDGAYYRTDYYQSRITPETTLDNIWEELAEGKMYGKGWDGSEAELITEGNDTLVDDMIDWLFLSTEEVEIVKIEMGELTKESFEGIKFNFEQVK